MPLFWSLPLWNSFLDELPTVTRDDGIWHGRKGFFTARQSNLLNCSLFLFLFPLISPINTSPFLSTEFAALPLHYWWKHYLLFTGCVAPCWRSRARADLPHFSPFFLLYSHHRPQACTCSPSPTWVPHPSPFPCYCFIWVMHFSPLFSHFLSPLLLIPHLCSVLSSGCTTLHFPLKLSRYLSTSNHHLPWKLADNKLQEALDISYLSNVVWEAIRPNWKQNQKVDGTVFWFCNRAPCVWFFWSIRSWSTVLSSDDRTTSTLFVSFFNIYIYIYIYIYTYITTSKTSNVEPTHCQIGLFSVFTCMYETVFN